MLRKHEQESSARRDINLEIDRLETKIKELQVLYEQYYIQLLPLPPDKEHKDVKQTIRVLLKAPFKNSQTRFRLRQVIQRYQTYNTYWERVNKQKEDGTYSRDVFKADIREKEKQQDSVANTQGAKTSKGIEQLFTSYQEALRNSGAKTDNLDFDAFRKNLVKRAKALKEQHGATKVKYRVVVKDGKVVIKASLK